MFSARDRLNAGSRSVTKMEMDGQLTEFTQVWSVAGSTLTVESTSARATQKRVSKQ